MDGQDKDIRAWMELTHPDLKLVRLFRDRGFSAPSYEILLYIDILYTSVRDVKCFQQGF